MDRNMLSVIKRAAIEGGGILMKNFHASYTIRKKGERDVVTSVDVEAERTIIKIIENIFPTHNILSEEKGMIDKKSDFTWIIDPLDGTGNYIRQIPIFGLTIALEHNNTVLYSIVYFPLMKQLLIAHKGEGAYINDQKLGKLEPCRKKPEELFLFICHGQKNEDIRKMIDYFNKIRPHVTDMRKLGAASLEITHVARGLADGYIAPGLPLWDFKAATLIVQEVGGTARMSKDGTLFVFAPGVEDILKKSLS